MLKILQLFFVKQTALAHMRWAMWVADGLKINDYAATRSYVRHGGLPGFRIRVNQAVHYAVLYRDILDR